MIKLATGASEQPIEEVATKLNVPDSAARLYFSGLAQPGLPISAMTNGPGWICSGVRKDEGLADEA